MKLAIISFTEQGNQWNKRLMKRFQELGEDCTGYILNRFLNPYHEQAGLLPVKDSLQAWTKEQFEQADGLIFIGATGIAVRAIAPFVKDKLTDPAVVAMDEQAGFSISLLSGHVGGANDLALAVAGITGAVPVITTATDVRHRFAVDVFAKNQGLRWENRELAKRISADVLEGIPVGFFSDYPVEGVIPAGFTQKESCNRNLWITCKDQVEESSFLRMFLKEDAEVLKLVPRTLILGIGCRKGVNIEQIRQSAEAALKAANLNIEGILMVATIDIKKEEPGLTAYGKELGVEFVTYTAGELERVPGEYADSPFVRETTGVGNVCERAAMAAALACGGGRLLAGKMALDGVTVAIAEKNWKVRI